MVVNAGSGCGVVAASGFGASFEGGPDAIGFGRMVVFASGFRDSFGCGAGVVETGRGAPGGTGTAASGRVSK